MSQTPLLFIADTNNQESPLVDFEKEKTAIWEIFDHLIARGVIQTIRQDNATIDKIRYYLNDFSGHVSIFHYIGHTGSESLFRPEDSANGTGIAKLLGAASALRLVFLNGCSTYEQVQSLHEGGVDAVIATNIALSDNKGREFAIEFYKAFANPSFDLAKAFEIATASLKTQYLDKDKITIHKGVEKPKSPNEFNWGLYVRQGAEDVLKWRLIIPRKINFNQLNQSILDEEEKALSEYPFMRLAALLVAFSLKDFHRIYGQIMEDKLDEEDLEILLEHSVFHGQSDIHSLKDHERKEILRDMDEEDQIKVNLHKLEGFDKSDSQVFYERVLQDGGLETSNLTSSQLVLALRFANWLSKTKFNLPSKEEINALIDRNNLLQPFEILTENFQGRKKELSKVEAYIESADSADPLLISGIGGIGKSTLLAKFILDFIGKKHNNQIPFIYLDFDRPGLSISEPLQLAAEGLRQIIIQFPQLQELLTDVRFDIQTYLRREKRRKERPIQKFSKSSQRTRSLVYDSIASQYIERYAKDLSQIKVPLVWVFDSFEEAQYRARISDLKNLFDFLDEIKGIIPSFRPIIIGRSDLVNDLGSFERMVIDSFDKESTIAYLEALGINNEKLNKEILEKLGGNPLTLQLAAQVVRREAEIQDIPIEDLKGRELFEKIDEGRIQEHLVRRNLDHIHDEEVRKLAVPGLLVRQISPEVIQQILAIPCGLGEISYEEAERLYTNLQKETFLLSESNGSLSFRQDLRVALYELIVQDKKVKSQEIRENAIAFYEGKTDPDDKAEYLYHRLMRGDDPAIVDEIYTEEIRPFIENSITELPINAYIHLAEKLNISVRAKILEGASPESLETYFNGLFQDIFETGSQRTLEEMRKFLKKYPQRKSASDIWHLEAKLYLRLQDLQNYRQKIRNITSSHQDSFRLHLLEAEKHEIQNQFKKALEHQTSALQINEQYSQVEASFNDRLKYFILCKRNGKSPDPKLMGPMGHKIEVENLLLPYREIVEREREVSDEISLFKIISVIEKNLESGEHLKRRIRELKSRFTDTKGVESFLFNEHEISINEISEAGVFSFQLVYLAKFLEQQDEEEESEDRSQKEITYKNIDKIKELVSMSRLEEAFSEAENLPISDPKLKNELILLKSRMMRAEEELQRGTSSTRDYNISRNQYTLSFLEWLDEVYKQSRGATSKKGGIKIGLRKVLKWISSIFKIIGDRFSENRSQPEVSLPPISIEEKNQVKKLIAENYIVEALEKTERICRGSGREKRINEILILRKQFQDVQKETRTGIISFDEREITLNRIRYNLLTLLDEL